MQRISRQDLFSAWQADALEPPVLCATRRLADALARDYARRRAAAGAQAWRAPDCQHWRAWLAECFQRYAAAEAVAGRMPPRLLAEPEALMLWRGVVEAASAQHPLLQTAQAARLAAEAWQLAHDYAIALPASVPDDEDAGAFDGWAQRFHGQLQSLQAVSGAELPGLLADAIADGRLPAPPRLVLAALERPTPAQQRLLSALESAGTELLRLEPAASGTLRIRYQPCADAHAELDAAARAVRDLALHEPEARIGVVVPDLAQRLEPLRRRFDAVLCPWLAPGDDPAQRPYAISQGEPLAAQPVVAAALDWLDWAGAPTGRPLSAAARCLRSPYWFGGAEPTAVGRAERSLRSRGYERLKLATAARALAGNGAGTAAEALSAVDTGRDRAPPSAWAQRFAATLQKLGWPGRLGSAEHQAHRAWNEALGAFARTDALCGALDARAALSRLREQLAQQPFQPQGGAARIQVLGLLEAAGLAFDHLFVLGMDETAWPPEARPVPLLPEALQRRAGIPQATAEGQLERARAIGEALLATAPKLTLSWAATVDQQPSRLSPLWPPPEAQPEAMLAAHPPAWENLRTVAAGEPWRDARATPPEAAQPLPGGERRLGEHAECPFRALAHFGLTAEAPAEPEAAPDARERGILAHEVMAGIWHRLRNSEALHALDAGAQSELVADCVEAALTRWRERAPHRFSEGVVAVETRRLQRHAEALLGADRQRAPFIVEWVEGAPPDSPEGRHDHPLALHGLQLRVRPDRVDFVPGFGRIVIDYKTGRADTPVGHTLTSPQLAVYAELVADCVGVAYAVLRAGDTGYVGLIDNDSIDALPAATRVEKLPKAAREALEATDWNAVRRLWEAQLATTAAGIRAGDAAVAPLPGVCRRCDLQPLCRIHETDALAGAEEDEA
jgi:probable DNA repair protein